jgi:hypothetical protein
VAKGGCLDDFAQSVFHIRRQANGNLIAQVFYADTFGDHLDRIARQQAHLANLPMCEKWPTIKKSQLNQTVKIKQKKNADQLI